ncbi:MAG: SDR family oxidoreductase [Burkholderiaceae bacterium]|nr:SDR family oxidoreductase [Burkholderiaceae bacterium]
MRLRNKVALITGAAKGIGFATAKRFTEEGAKVMLADLNEGAVMEAVGQLKNAEPYVLNVTDRASIEEQFDAVIDVNLKGVFNCTQLVVPHMLEAKKGAIVNASSVVGIYGNFGQTNYSATKFGVIGFTKTWAREFGQKGIRVNAVCPGFIATEMVKAMPENILQSIEQRSWMARLGTPEEMANVYLFLASDEASYVNGVTIEASGGISL